MSIEFDEKEIGLFKQEEIMPQPVNQLDDILQNNSGILNLTNGEFQSPNFSTGLSGWKINSNGEAEFQNVNIGRKTITISSTQSIQAALDALSVAGGGTLNLKAGTYVVTTALTGTSNVIINGEGRSNTIIYFAGTSANLSFSGTNIYTTGTVTAISGYNVTGSGTSWTSSMAGQSIFIGTRWYIISSVTDATHIVLAEPYGDNVTLPTTYRIATVIRDARFYNVSLAYSSGTALSFTDCRGITFNTVQSTNSAKGITFTNCSEVQIDTVITALNSGNGIEYTNVGLADIESMLSNGNGGHGIVLNNMKSSSIATSVADSNTSDGWNITSTTDLDMQGFEARSNGGQGVELVSGNENLSMSQPIIYDNVSDGVKLTATSDNTKIYGGKMSNNGGYGINIAASSCDNTVITTNVFSTNTSGAVNDSGTGTLVRGNVGVDDNSTNSGTRFDLQQFTSSGTWTKPTSISPNAIVNVQVWGAGGSGSKSNAGGNSCGGGGGGEFIEYQFKASDLTSTVSVTIGAGGSAVSTNNTDGSNGGDSTFGSYITAKGGSKGITNSPANAGTGGNAGNPFGAINGLWGNGGVTAAGEPGIYAGGGGGAQSPGSGGASYPGGDTRFGGGGGGGASSTTVGAGGVSTFGGAGGTGSRTGTATSGAQPGGGGGGCVASGNSGAGGDGKVIVRTIY